MLFIGLARYLCPLEVPHRGWPILSRCPERVANPESDSSQVHLKRHASPVSCASSLDRYILLYSGLMKVRAKKGLKVHGYVQSTVVAHSLTIGRMVWKA